MPNIAFSDSEPLGDPQPSRGSRMGQASDTFWRFGASHAIIWAAFLLVGTATGYLIPRTIWDYPLIPSSLRAGLVTFSGITLLPLTLLIAALLAAPRFSVIDDSARSIIRRITRCLSATLATFLVFLYGASWASYYSTGQFLGLAGMGMWIANPVQLLEHVIQLEPELLLLIPPASLLVATALLRGVPRVLALMSARGWRGLTLLSLVLVGLFVHAAQSDASTVSALHMKVLDRDVGARRDFAKVYTQARNDRTSPMAHVVTSLLRPGARDMRIGDIEITVPVDSAPTETIDNYLFGVKATRVHRRNVVVLVVESLRSDELKPYGGRRVVMPAVERLAKESRVFTNNVTTATHSDYASVVPLSGQYPLRSPQPEPYPQDPTYPRVLIYDILNSLGYHTAVFSSQNEYWGGMYYYLNTGNIDHFFHSESYRGPSYTPQTDVGFAQWVQGGKHAGKLDDRITVDAAMQWVDSLYRDQPTTDPFFMYVNLQSSHVPYQRPADFPPRFGAGSTSFTIGFNRFPPDSAAAVRDAYDNSLAYLDSQVGRLIAHLKARGLWENTVFVLTGDHGQAFFEHGFAAHGNIPYSELARAPLLIKAPGLEPGSDPRPSQHVDVPPTVLALLGLPPHPAFQGIDLTGDPPRAERPRFVIAQTPLANAYSVVSGRYTLILDNRSGFLTLYDDLLDPGQKRDLSRSLPAVRDTLAHELDMWRSVQLKYYGRQSGQFAYYAPTLRFGTSSRGHALKPPDPVLAHGR